MKIVVGIDEQDASIYALRRAIDLAARTGAELHVVYAVYLPGTLLAVLGQMAADVPALEAEQEKAVWDRVAPEIAKSPVTIHEHSLRGYPGDVLADFAANIEADMLVVGSRGRGELTSFLMGSTGHRVLHHAPCDVLIVKGEDR